MEDDPDVEYWMPFLDRMKNIPMEYQLAILREYEVAESQGRDLNVERMWDLLLAGEGEVKCVERKIQRAN